MLAKHPTQHVLIGNIPGDDLRSANSAFNRIAFGTDFGFRTIRYEQRIYRGKQRTQLSVWATTVIMGHRRFRCL